VFSTHALNVRTSDGRNMVLLDSFTYTSKTGRVVVVPVGATSDGASTPREIWAFIPPFGTYWMAAFLHDYLYRSTDLPKDVCDSLLEEAMEDLCVDLPERYAIYHGVTLGGESSFVSDRTAQTSNP
jgi:uncharacterized protein DUF1353